MTATASQPKKSKSPAGNQKEVAIIGGGVAGLTCALRLSERGYAVTLYEKDEMSGGQLSSVKSGKNGMYHDVYTHLFPDWYVNFWRILEADLKIKREDAFEPRFSVKLLLDPSTNPRHSTNSAPKYVELKNPNTASNIVDNLLSGALPPPDMFLVGFALLDLASQHFGSSIIQQQTVNGFLYSRPYATEDCAELHNTILNEIWCTSSSDTSATAYRDFVRHSLGSRGLPFAWLLRNSLEENLIRPWQERLNGRCKISMSTEITAVEVGDEITLTLSDKTKATYPNIVLAVPAPELTKLVMSSSPGRRIVDRIPQLSELQRLRTACILVVTVFFKEKLPSIPPEHVGLTGSLGYLTFIDISQLWTSLSSVKDKHTVLILAASDSSAYPSTTNEDWAHLMLKELAHYLPAVKPGDRWGDANSNIDYSKSLPQNNHSHPLFQNDMNSEQIIPRPSYPDLLDNVFFAGDFCFNEVNMSTVEAAVLSGLHAARELQIKVEGKSDIEIERGNIPSTAQYSAAKLALLPLAYGATAWSAVNALMKDLSDGQPDISEAGLSPAMTLTLIPLRYLADWIASLEALGVAVLSSGRESDGAASTLEQRLRTAVRGVLSTIDHVCSLASGRPADRLRAVSSLPADALRAASLAASERPMERPPRTDQTRRPAPAQGHRLLRGTGRYRKYGHVRRHRAKP